MLASLGLLMATASGLVDPTKIVDHANGMTVQIMVDGKGPYPFLIDTGADRSVISDKLATDLALASGGQLMMHGILGRSDVPYLATTTLELGDKKLRTLAMPVMPQTSINAPGVLGADALGDQLVTIDFKRHEMALGEAAGGKIPLDGPGTVVLNGKQKLNQIVIPDARYHGRKILVIIDTGAEATIGNMALRALAEGSSPLKVSNKHLIDITGNALPTEEKTLQRLQLGRLTMPEIPVSYTDLDTFRTFGMENVPALLIGMDVLRLFQTVTIDYRHKQIRLVIEDLPFWLT
nr:aspartyl protease family protein [Sphingomonas vulcanisoli]